MAQEANRVWDSVDMYAVRCFLCSKWRIMPNKEKYEEIREHILQNPFQCETASEWCPNVSCEDESDITRDNNLFWAMDKPSIPQTPPGWQRIIRLRAEGGKKFADVYYVSPTNKRFRSMVELESYLNEHPEYQEQHVTASRFSFQVPVPLSGNYVAKRRAVWDFSTLVPVPVDYAVSPIHDMEEDVDVQCVGDIATTEVEAPETGECSNNGDNN